MKISFTIKFILIIGVLLSILYSIGARSLKRSRISRGPPNCKDYRWRNNSEKCSKVKNCWWNPDAIPRQCDDINTLWKCHTNLNQNHCNSRARCYWDKKKRKCFLDYDNEYTLTSS